MEGLRNGRRASGSRESNGYWRDQSCYASMQLGTTRRSLLKSHRLTRGHRGKSGTALRFQKRLRIQESATQFVRPSMFHQRSISRVGDVAPPFTRRIYFVERRSQTGWKMIALVVGRVASRLNVRLEFSDGIF